MSKRESIRFLNINGSKRRLRGALIALLVVAASGLGGLARADDVTVASCEVLDLVVVAPAGSRAIPVRVRLPGLAAPAPLVLFSHGLGGSARHYAYLGEHWCGAGFAVAHLQHPGSDETVWQGKGREGAIKAMHQAGNVENLLLRIDDVHDVINQLTVWRQQVGHALQGRIDTDRIGMAGHSFGALTTQAVSGQRFESPRVRPPNPRIRAALILSPSAPRTGDAAKAFGQVSRPWMLMTGTEDVSAFGSATLDDRLAVYPALPAGSKYELVLDGAKHLAFGDREVPGARGRRNPAHHAVIRALSTAFWRAWLTDDKPARQWLAGPGVGALLADADRWQTK